MSVGFPGFWAVSARLTGLAAAEFSGRNLHDLVTGTPLQTPVASFSFFGLLQEP
ncbi:hypothetical protein AB395_00006547 (plasmid) [Sinorhizobium fredii CCBAU 45436]|nr:hypothetical protein AB395_00006547 [Sinorhizobium fredii CCBAU 45436]